ncbi:MAG: hypothetical protein CMK07_01780 [Ponticaulis sp.]|nr:hypothetical protein [Ponticaulis sp.]
MIAVFLARLFTALVNLQTSGRAIVSTDIAHMVTSSEALVHVFIRNLAAAELKSAGFSVAANAVRATRKNRIEVDYPTDAEPPSPAELLERLAAIIAMFERAEELAQSIARMIVWALGLLSPRDRGPQLSPAALRAPSPVNGRQHTPQPTDPCPPPDWPTSLLRKSN